MSYILEAIRRSEEERRKRIVPGVSTIHARPPARPTIGARSGSIIVLAAGAGLAVALVMAARSWPWPQSGSEMSARSEAQAVAPAPPGNAAITAPGVDAATDAATTAPAADVAARGPQPERPEENAPTLSQTVPPPRPPDAPAAAATPAPGQAREPDAGAGAGETKIEHKKQPRTPYSASAAQPTRQAKALGPRVAQPTPGPVESGNGLQTSMPAPPPEPAPEIVNAVALADLPESVQRALPDIDITLHRYAANPAARMIRVNGRTAREGDALTAHLGVAEITRNGVVFTIDDQRFYMDAFQNWQAKHGS